MVAIHAYVDSGKNVTSPRHIYNALTSKPIESTTTMLISVNPKPKSKMKAFPVSGSRSTSDIKFVGMSNVYVYDHTDTQYTRINMVSDSVIKWRKSYQQLGIDFLQVKKTKVTQKKLSLSTKMREVATTTTTKDKLQVPSISLEINSDATQAERRIGNFIQSFTSSQVSEVKIMIATISELLISGEPPKVSCGWASRKYCRVVTIKLPPYVIDVLKLLVNFTMHR